MSLSFDHAFFIAVSVAAHRGNDERMLDQKIDHFVAAHVIFRLQTHVGMRGCFLIEHLVPEIIVEKDDDGKALFKLFFKGIHGLFREIIK